MCRNVYCVRVTRTNILRTCTRDIHVDDVSLHTYIHTNIHKYSDFLIVLISVGLASARPNQGTVQPELHSTLSHIEVVVGID